MSECTFQPKINQKSSKIGSRKNSFGNSADLVDRLHDWKTENLRNKLSLQAKQVEQEKKRGGSRSSRNNAPGSQSNFPESHYTDLGHFRSAQKISEDYPREQKVNNLLQRISGSYKHIESPYSIKNLKSRNSSSGKKRGSSS